MFDMEAQKDFLVAIDSDGCVFDTMELKHKECFIPNIIKTYGLQPVSKYVREIAEFLNLYSRNRGFNRFPGVVATLEMLKQRPEVVQRGFKVPEPTDFIRWVKEETHLNNPVLEAKIRETDSADLKQALEWSKAVNKTIAEMVHHVPPFPFVRESLSKLSPVADLLVCSATPKEALVAEWGEHGIAKFVREICGQEQGTKKEILAISKRYPKDQVLMVGDAPGDHAAAKANGALFFPILPGREDESWKQFFNEAIEKFLAHSFAGAYQEKLLAEFYDLLPENPPFPLLEKKS